MAEPDKRQLGDGSDSFSNAASNLSRAVNTMRQQASASSAGAAAAGAAKTGKAIAGAAKSAAAAGPWGALAAAAWSARHTLYKLLICTALFFTFIIVTIVSLPSIVTNGIFGLNGTKPVEGATLTDTYSEMAKAVSSVADYGYELSLARVDLRKADATTSSPWIPSSTTDTALPDTIPAMFWPPTRRQWNSRTPPKRT